MQINKYYCKEKDCNKVVTGKSRRCKSCANKGGRNPFYGKKHTEENRKIIKFYSTGKNNPMYGKSKELSPKFGKSNKWGKHSLESRKKISKNNAKTMLGKKWSKEMKKQMSLSHGGTGIPYELTEYGAEFDNPLKEQIRFRDKYKCKECGCSQLENDKQLDIHHMDYNKKNNRIDNLVALCHSCHMRTNKNREYWTKYFKKKIKEFN